MAQFELYRVLPQGRRRLCAAIDGETDGIVAVRNATPVIMQAQGQRLHTAVAPTPKPKPTAQPKPAARICAQCESLQCHCGQTPRRQSASQPRLRHGRPSW